MPHRVTIAELNRSFEVDDDETMLIAALRANIHIPHDCKSGTCATCRFRLIEGEIAYREDPMALSPEERDEGYALACQAWPQSDLVASVEILPALMSEPQRHTATVDRVEPLSDDVMRLVLRLPEGVDPAYRPGQYVNIVMDDGSVRSFSIASPPNGQTIDFHIRRIHGGSFTDTRLAGLQPGHSLPVELPHGAFFLRKADFRPLLMVATGTGLAPIKSILESLHNDPDCPPVTLYWGMRREQDLYLHDEIQGWGDRLPEFNYVPVLSRPGEGWQGRTGYVQDAACADIEDFSEYAIYLCGSPDMIADAKRRFMAQGASLNHIYADSFFFQHNLKRR
ncbi:MAG TPA: 2Fe-2S iron-sulfur cluster-binding protein [Bauldia sp.]|nr:2Fe-2S iron-sulfur cluster-binding protein [Bauldia sp.]